MPIFDQGYQHWDGKLAGHAWRWWAITRRGVRAQWKNRGTRFLILGAWSPAIILVGFLSIWGLFEQKSSLLAPFLQFFQGLPDEIRQGPRAFRTSIWTYAFYFFLTIESFFAMLLVLSVGPDLISQDLRFNAVPLYLSRPLRRWDYFLGKLGVIGVYIGAVTILPVVVAYVLGLAFSLDVSVVRDTGGVFLAAVGYGVLVAASAGLLMLAISSLSRNSRYVGAMWVGLWLVSNGAAGVIGEATGRKWAPIVSYTANLDRMREVMLDVATAKQQFANAAEEAQREVQGTMGRGLFGGRFGGGRGRARPPRPPHPPHSPANVRLGEHPWTWSAGVLAGLAVVSLWTLSTRVKSLDRIK